MPNLTGAKFLSLCTVAVGAIYAAGYVYTEPSAQANPLSAKAPISTSKSSRSGLSATSPSSHSTSSTKGPSTSPSTPSSVPVYKDGTYTGSGANPYGTLSVAVEIVHGRITRVQITQYNMHYPESIIDPILPKEVISMQTWRIYVVTGATASTYNFAEAVYNALQKAKG
ncbi:FMN-binding protein [Sulfobacillus thermosulfidooxidans]|uniref:FMN-binding protein n=1 Tax=Sulfobacillus thermosulfidooxidans TaxID=28034 RepID=UPI00096B7E71|nr:hypothetical protein [Sulfobacillus thermosulfidooxidans]OLZ11112.1 hypothetical protein BFX05_08205 [Sulfobacillus thermosulfidooxidans]OLZ14095.1 hypothetical protein BFX06_07255 [Sulfobacillus thermosulfidooxidans]OLZ18839.1 hypothetical protein BFX07_03650 [Sulfobacillus thermosulfidooxidans]